MKKITLLFVLSAMVSMTACKETKKTDGEDAMTEETEMDDSTEMEETAMAKEISFDLEPKSDSGATGTVTFEEVDGQVKMTAVLQGLSEGTHAIHIHETGDCTSPDGKSAGGHWNPTHENHGKWGAAEGYHKGDIGNFEADASGNGSISMTTDEWCIGCEDATKNIVGKGIIVHQGADDFTSQPSGAAGARVMCGGIIE